MLGDKSENKGGNSTALNQLSPEWSKPMSAMLRGRKFNGQTEHSVGITEGQQALTTVAVEARKCR